MEPELSDDLRVAAVVASAGGVEALGALLATLPVDLPGTVLLSLHLSPAAPSMLPQILGRRTKIPVVGATHGAPLVPGSVVVAVPDAHLLLDRQGRVALGLGARENGHRPSHDALLRSVALSLGQRATGVVLTGLLDDGAAGLQCIDRYGGSCLVQSPEDADYPDMPRNALRTVPKARQAPLDALAEELVRALTEPLRPAPAVDPAQRAQDVAELASAVGSPVTLEAAEVLGRPSPFACPDCHGVLNVMPDDQLARFRCRTGHAWTADSLLARQGTQVEAALWTALRTLEERGELSRQLASRAERDGWSWSAEHHRARERQAVASAEAIREALLDTRGGSAHEG